MLQDYIEQFLRYCQVSNFSVKSIEAFTARLEGIGRFEGTNLLVTADSEQF